MQNGPLRGTAPYSHSSQRRSSYYRSTKKRYLSNGSVSLSIIVAAGRQEATGKDIDPLRGSTFAAILLTPYIRPRGTGRSLSYIHPRKGVALVACPQSATLAGTKHISRRVADPVRDSRFPSKGRTATAAMTWEKNDDLRSIRCRSQSHYLDALGSGNYAPGVDFQNR